MKPRKVSQRLIVKLAAAPAGSTVELAECHWGKYVCIGKIYIIPQDHAPRQTSENITVINAVGEKVRLPGSFECVVVQAGKKLECFDWIDGGQAGHGASE